MIVKDHSIPIALQMEEALLRRLPSHHPQRALVSENLAKRKAGYKGEQSIDYYLNQLNEDFFHIYHDLRLPAQDGFFQLDTLLVSPHFFLILEVKNISGTLFFDGQFNQLIRTLHGKEEGFRNPLMQVKSQHRYLEQFLSSHQFPDIPIEYLVVISNPSTIIKSNDKQAMERVIHADALIGRVSELASKHTKNQKKKNLMAKAKNFLLENHLPHFPSLLDNYQITPSDIQPGVQCPDCQQLPMVRKKRTWHCPACLTTSHSAHQQAIIDYLLLVSPTITNSQCRNFLRFPSKNAVTRSFSKMNLVRTGRGKATCYQLDC